jgi:plastocyanin
MHLKELRSVAVVLAMMAAACSSEKQAAPAAPPPDAKRVDDSKAGSVTGRVTIEGAVPANAPIKFAADPFCQRANANGAAFESFVVKDGGLENVFVYVKDGLGTYHFDIPSEPVKLDQQGCQYKPHVIGVRAGQPIEFSNSDSTMHNVHALAEVNQEFNFSQSMQGMKNTRTFTAREVMVRFKCDVHGWMSAYAGVMDHPYFAVTKDGGRFELKNLPAGTYTVEAWHEKLGTEMQSVTLGEKESKSITFAFRGEA